MGRALLVAMLVGLTAALVLILTGKWGHKAAQEETLMRASAPSHPEMSRISEFTPRSTTTGAAEPVTLAEPEEVAQVALPTQPSSVSEAFLQPSTPEEYWQHLEELRRTDKEQALAYALAGDEWYPDSGKPAEARRAMIVTLLVDLGRMSEARERTHAFIKQYPQSPYRRLAQGVTGIHPRPGRPGVPSDFGK